MEKQVKGFTMIELLPVITLIGILASLVAFVYLDKVSKAKEAHAIAYSGAWIRVQKVYYFQFIVFQNDFSKLDLGQPPEFYDFEVQSDRLEAEIQLCARPDRGPNRELLRPIASHVYVDGLIGAPTELDTINVRSRGPGFRQC